ncbi:MAG: tetratricopeptide repeat protein [Bacteroidetes bacterium]|nr:MAG: tetratricopeptide repeat protein [Bacteroidota bacterium]
MNLRFFLICLFLFFVPAAFAQPDPEADLAERYFADGEYEPALNLFLKLHSDSPSEPYVRRIADCYEKLDQYDEAIRFLQKAIRKDEDNTLYPLLLAGVLEKTGELKEADKLYDDVITRQLMQEGDFVQAGVYLYQAGKLDLSRQTYLQARKRLKETYIFANELSNIYLAEGDFENAAKECLNIYFENTDNLGMANISILNITGPSTQTAIERVLLSAIEARQNDLGLRTILFEFYVLAENFPEAYIQVKAIDRLFKEDGERIFRFAETMRNNKNYDLANEALDYLIERKKTSPYFFAAHFEKAGNSERKAFDQIPADMAAVQQAVNDYGRLLDEFGRKSQFFDAVYRRSSLMVFYTNDLNGAQAELENILRLQQSLKPEDWAKAKLLLGDVLLIKQEYNKAKLTYTEVADAFRDRQTGAMAKFKLAQLAYYKGEFNLAQAQLEAIKDNTSNDISNDAIKLGLLIIDNTGLDSTTTALEMFAQAQLLTYQRKYTESMAKLDSLAQAFPDHPLADEILWEKANIYLKNNDIQTTLSYLERILDVFSYDIYGDDALYTKARIYDFTLKQPEAAMQMYLEFLTRFPGSLYSVEIRKRIRELRQG